MILDDNLTFCKATDTAAATTPAIPLGQGDLAGNSKGLTPYNNLILHVSAGEAITAMTVTLETADTKGGTFEPVQVYPAKANLKPGDAIVNERLPWGCRNWLRLKFSEAKKVNAHLALDTEKKYPMV